MLTLTDNQLAKYCKTPGSTVSSKCLLDGIINRQCLLAVVGQHAIPSCKIFGSFFSNIIPTPPPAPPPNPLYIFLFKHLTMATFQNTVEGVLESTATMLQCDSYQDVYYHRSSSNGSLEKGC